MTLGMDSAAPRDAPDTRETNQELFLIRARVGLWAVLVAISAFALADLELVRDGLRPALLVRLVQFALIGAASLSLRARMSHLMATVVFVSAI
jgi:hypothetical protein